MSSREAIMTCKALYSTVGISFWGGICPVSGIVIDQTHSLHGECVSGKILCIPSGRGSCTGSQVMLELILNGKGPRAIILRSADSILCTGAIVAEEFFGDECAATAVPIICAVGEDKFAQLVGNDRGLLSIKRLGGEGDDEGDVCIQSGDDEIITKDLLKLKDLLVWDDDANGNTNNNGNVVESSQSSPATELALRTVRRVASISGAKELIPITSAHIDAVTYIGPGGLKFARKLADLGGKVKVKTTLNSQSCDRRRWKELGVDASLAANANSVGDAYLELGCEMSFTCAPYLLPSRPTKGENIIWGESNAVVYSNSVIGARTEKYADYFDICAAIVGCVPNVGVHIEENRAPTIVIDATKLIQDHLLANMNDNEKNSDDLIFEHGLDSFFPAMGWTCGNLSDGGIPLILGFDSLPSVSNDNLKAFCAAFGTTGSAPLFHIANVTPEALGGETIKKMVFSCGERWVEVTMNMLRKSYETLDSGNDGNEDISLVALGNPHLSVEELGRLSNLIHKDDRPKHESVQVTATLGRHVHSKGRELGYTQKLESFGVQFINDTCWCMLLDSPIIPANPNAKILTNSGKYAHYGPGLTNRSIRFGSMYDCVEVAKSGKMKQGGGSNSLPQWLRSFSTQRLIRSIKRIK
ncbi:hypothetical protein ACHAXR_012021 [Thalassiosira sp. AJA248-18]